MVRQAQAPVRSPLKSDLLYSLYPSQKHHRGSLGKADMDDGIWPRHRHRHQTCSSLSSSSNVSGSHHCQRLYRPVFRRRSQYLIRQPRYGYVKGPLCSYKSSERIKLCGCQITRLVRYDYNVFLHCQFIRIVCAPLVLSASSLTPSISIPNPTPVAPTSLSTITTAVPAADGTHGPFGAHDDHDRNMGTEMGKETGTEKKRMTTIKTRDPGSNSGLVLCAPSSSDVISQATATPPPPLPLPLSTSLR
ncbi:hypothetical protein PQX77_021943 [Marasmius sp. AFHP31]|nr:hypothetical protein PQX77_021943 [Marasmius sp. AFHP31]